MEEQLKDSTVAIHREAQRGGACSSQNAGSRSETERRNFRGNVGHSELAKKLRRVPLFQCFNCGSWSSGGDFGSDIHFRCWQCVQDEEKARRRRAGDVRR